MPVTDGGAHVVVTVESIYNLLLEVRDEVRGSTQKLEDLVDDSADHERRIRLLEMKVWLATGLAAAGGGLLGKLIGT